MTDTILKSKMVASGFWKTWKTYMGISGTGVMYSDWKLMPDVILKSKMAVPGVWKTLKKRLNTSEYGYFRNRHDAHRPEIDVCGHFEI